MKKVIAYLALVSLLVAQAPLRSPQSIGAVDNSAAISSIATRLTTSAPSGSCTIKGDMQTFSSGGTSQLWICTPTTGTACPCTWIQASGGVTGSSGVITGPTVPGSCATAGNLFEDTTYYELYFCTPSLQYERLAKMVPVAGDPNAVIPFGCDSAAETGRFANNSVATSAATAVWVCSITGAGPTYGWSAIAATGGPGSGATKQTELTDMKVTTNATTTITVPAGNMPYMAPTVCADYTGGNVVMSGGTTGVPVYISVGNDCLVHATSTATFGTATGITTNSGSAYIDNSFPLARCTYTGSVPTIACTDDRRAFGSSSLLAGTNISLTRSASGITIASTGAGGGSVTKVPYTLVYGGAGSGQVNSLGAGFLTGSATTDPKSNTLAGSGAVIGGIEFEDADSGVIDLLTQIPTGWDGGTVSLRLQVSTADYGPAVGTINVSVGCAANGTSLPVTFGTPQAVTATLGNGSTYANYVMNLASLTMGSCAVGSELRVRFQRDTADAFPNVINLKSVALTYLVTLQ